MSKTAEELEDYNLGYKEGEIAGTNYVMQIRAANYTNSESLAEKIAASVMERFNNKTVSYAFVIGFRDAMRSIVKMFEEATKALKHEQDE
jgi:hypothetical protein